MVTNAAQRIALTDEWHARPRLDFPTLFRCSHVVARHEAGGLSGSRKEFAGYCAELGRPAPSARGRVHSVQAGTSLVKWEGHTEWSSHTVIVSGNGTPLFGETALDFLGESKRDALVDSMFMGVQMEVVRRQPDDPTGYDLAKSLLGSDEIYGGWVSARTAAVWSSFQLDAEGFFRIIVIADEGHPERLSRVVQRLLDLESYRMLAMLGLPSARKVMSSLASLESELDQVMRSLAEDRASVDERRALNRITDVAAKVESIAAENAYRFAASQAYGRIIERRIAEVDEEAAGDHQRYTQFLSRSLQPAMRTCEATDGRSQMLADRVARAAAILDTMVDVSQREQNQRILVSLAESSKLQLKLQQAVEGFSIVAISYYAVGLISYGLKALKASGVSLDADLLSGLTAPLVLSIVWLTVRRVKKELHLGGDIQE